MWRARAERADTSELRRIVREELELGPDDTLTISEMACPKAGCPPVETVISIFPADEDTYLVRVCKAVADVEPMDVIAALAWGDHPEGFNPSSLFPD
ncbi:MAG: hypothetical protein ABIS47_00840 [Acidimicrobiales bacterium]